MWGHSRPRLSSRATLDSILACGSPLVARPGHAAVSEAENLARGKPTQVFLPYAIKAKLGKFLLPEAPGPYVRSRLAKQGIRSLSITQDHTLSVYDLRSSSPSQRPLRSPDHCPGTRRGYGDPHFRPDVQEAFSRPGVVRKIKVRQIRLVVRSMYARLKSVTNHIRRHSQPQPAAGTVRRSCRHKSMALSSPWAAGRSPTRRDDERCDY
jgi:hypothetical protein